jgi:hypothetical protein
MKVSKAIRGRVHKVGDSPKNYVKEQRKAASSRSVSFQIFDIIVY